MGRGVTVATVVTLILVSSTGLTARMTARTDGDVRPQVLVKALEACVQDASIDSYLVAYKELSR